MPGIHHNLNSKTATRLTRSAYHNRREIVTDAPDVRGLDRFAARPTKVFAGNAKGKIVNATKTTF